LLATGRSHTLACIRLSAGKERTIAKTLLEVCRHEDLPNGGRAFAQRGSRQIAIFNVEGELHALPNICPHQLGPLCRGKISGTLVATEESGWSAEWVWDGEIVTCPWHGLEFHIPTGQCLAYPNVRLRNYEVIVEDGIVKVAV
jgi:nitrite reductase/ring-hydroxylating ferredoxin subunit